MGVWEKRLVREHQTIEPRFLPVLGPVQVSDTIHVGGIDKLCGFPQHCAMLKARTGRRVWEAAPYEKDGHFHVYSVTLKRQELLAL